MTAVVSTFRSGAGRVARPAGADARRDRRGRVAGDGDAAPESYQPAPPLSWSA